MRLLILALLLAAAPASAQDAPDPGPSPGQAIDATPEAVLRDTWTETLGSATAVSWALDEAETAASAEGDEAVDDTQTALMTASLGAAASSGALTAALRFSLALADAAQRPQISAALTADTEALGGLLVLVAEETSAAALVPSGDDFADDAGEAPASWGTRADQIRALVGRLDGATKALGIAAP